MATLTTTRTERGFNKPAYKYIREADKLPVTLDPNLDADQIVCRVRLFNPTGSGTWWLASYDPESGIAFGIAELFERELGDIYMPELVAHRGLMGLPIERDIHFRPQTVAAILTGSGR